MTWTTGLTLDRAVFADGQFVAIADRATDAVEIARAMNERQHLLAIEAQVRALADPTQIREACAASLRALDDVRHDRAGGR